MLGDLDGLTMRRTNAYLLEWTDVTRTPEGLCPGGGIGGSVSLGDRAGGFHLSAFFL